MSAARKPNLCDLAQIVQAVLIDHHDLPYVSNKVLEMDGMSGPEVLAWAVVYLDIRNQIALSRALGLEEHAMSTLRRVFEKVRHARLPKKEAQPCSSQ